MSCGLNSNRTLNQAARGFRGFRVVEPACREDIAVMLDGEERLRRLDRRSLFEYRVLKIEKLFAEDRRLSGDEDEHCPWRYDALGFSLAFLDGSWKAHEFIDSDERPGDVVYVGRYVCCQRACARAAVADSRSEDAWRFPPSLRVPLRSRFCWVQTRFEYGSWR